MSNEINHDEFFRVLLENSKNKEVNLAIKEWNFIESYKSPNHCICGHNILENMVIKNKYNNKTLIVGNICIKKFLKQDLNYIISGVNSIQNNKIPNKEFINYCYDKGYLYENQKDFLLKIFRKRKITELQESFKNKILYKLKLRNKY